MPVKSKFCCVHQTLEQLCFSHGYKKVRNAYRKKERHTNRQYEKFLLLNISQET